MGWGAMKQLHWKTIIDSYNTQNFLHVTHI